MLYFLLCLFTFSISGCQHKTASMTVYTGTAMTIDYKIMIGSHLTEIEKKRVETLISQTFAEVNSIYNKWNPNSELSTLNQLKKGETYPLSPQMEHFLNLTDKIVVMTQGRFDPTIEPLQQLWKRHFEQNTIPHPEEIASLIPAVGWNKIHFSRGFFYKDHDRTCLDLGGIAKGYCVDLLIERLHAAGHRNVYVEWGGEIRTSGHHPNQRPWTIFISLLGDPNPENAVEFLQIDNQAIATSGDYLQQWTVNGTVYFHIINPQTYSPLESKAQSIASASVLASSCMLADGLSTALMLFLTKEDAEIWAESLRKNNVIFNSWIISR